MSGMSILTEARMNSDNLQVSSVWNNALFDGDDDKENRHAPAIRGRLSATKASTKIVHSGIGDGYRPIDDEIEEVEREIKRLSKRLEDLKLKRAESGLKAALESSRRGRVVAARFMEDLAKKKKVEEEGEEAEENARLRRRGVSLGPLEITPLRSATQSRRKSCFLRNLTLDEEEEGGRKTILAKESIVANPDVPSVKLDGKTAETESSRSLRRSTGLRKRGVSPGPAEITISARNRQLGGGSRNGLPGIKEEGKSGVVVAKRTRTRSVSPPKSRKPGSKLPDPRKGVMTIAGARYRAKEGGEPPMALQPRALFQDETDSKKKKNNPLVGGRSKGVMKGRTVSSRYSIITQPRQSRRRKWSLPDQENNSGGGDKDDKRSVGSLRGLGANAVADEHLEREEEENKSAEIKEEKEELKYSAEMESPVGSLPKIQTSRCAEDSPRDSGPLKRISELAGRCTYFGGRMYSTCSQELRFECGEEDDEMHSDAQEFRSEGGEEEDDMPGGEEEDDMHSDASGSEF